jgi:hypothetical protein
LTYERIAQTTLGATATAITFSSLPTTYTHLRLVVVGKNDQATVSQDVGLQFNGDTATNYSLVRMEGNGSTASSLRSTAGAYARIGYLPGSSVSNPGMVTFDVCNYGSSIFKTSLAVSVNDQNGSGIVARGVGAWRSTAAITSVSVIGGAGSFTVGTVATLYGIKRA